MTSPYLDQRVRPYHPGNQNKSPGIGTVTYVETTAYNSDGLRPYVAPKPTPLSGAGKVKNQRKVQNPGFNL